MLYIDPLGLDTAQVYGSIYNGDGLFKAQSAYEFLKNKAKRDSDFSEAFNSINSNGSNKRPLTPEELLPKRKAEEDRLRRIEYDAKRHNYGKGQTKDGINSVLDLAGKVNDGLGGAADGLKYNGANNLKLYIGKFKPSSSYGFKVFVKPIVQGSVGTSLVKKTGFLGHAINAASVYGTYTDEGYIGATTKVAGAKALTGWAGASAGAKIGATAGAMIGAGYFGVGAAPGAVIGGLFGGVLGGWGASSLADEIYQ